MKLQQNLFDTFQSLRQQQQQRKVALFAQYDSSIKQQTAKPDTQPGQDPAKPATQLTFGNISSKQLRQWLEQSVKSGKITEEQSSAFKALIYSATGGDTSKDAAVVNFSDKAKQVLQSAVKRHDTAAMALWANTLSAMKKFEGETLPTPKKPT